MDFESAGWSHIQIDSSALDVVQGSLVEAGVAIRPLDLGTFASGFAAFLKLPVYRGEYQRYGGAEEHCLLEKALEHYLSFELIRPSPGMIGIDVGSCRSVVPTLLREQFGCRCYEQDLEYPAGVHGDKIGSSADAIPLPDCSVDFMTLHCTFEHFEGSADTGFVRECSRLLKAGGKVVILPLYLNPNFCNVTGEGDAARRETIGFDREASYHCLIPEWQNRFGRHYSPEALLARVLKPAAEANLQVVLYRVANWEAIHPSLWLRWIAVLTRA